eukprot:g14672.t1
MSGPASETSVLLSAGVSLVVFVCYFASILLAVPKHWGVPFKSRLSRYVSKSRQGLLVETLNAAFSLATCVLFILETYSIGRDYGFIVVSFSLEMAFNGFFLCNFVLHLYLAVDKLVHLVSLQPVVDIVTVFPSYLILFVNDGWRTADGGFADAYLGLKIARVVRVARLLVTISFLASGPSLAYDHSRQILVLRAQLVRWGLKTVVVIFILAGLTNFLVEVQDADWGNGYGYMPFHDALYFVIVSFSTVGYGDISPSTPLSRLVITGLILTLFFCVPIVTNAVYDVARLRPKHGGRLSKNRGTGHIVVGCDASCLRVVSVLLRELLATDSMAYHHAHVVLVVPQEPTLAWEALLCLQPSFAVTYLNGDLSSAEDLRRARVQDARACFVLSDRLAGDTEAQDKTALVRALCANQASRPGPDGTSSVLCLVTHTKSKVRLVRLGMPSASVVCYDEVMEGLVTNASLHPGFSTVWANLMSCMPEADYLLEARAAERKASRRQKSTVVFETEMEYLRSLQRVMVRFHLDAFVGELVGDVAIELFENCGCTLFALICTTGSGVHESETQCGGRKGERTCVRVHPDYSSVVESDDVGVFIGANNKTADLLARYCAAREPSKSASAASKPSGGSHVGGGDRLERTVWSEIHGSGNDGDPATASISPIGKHLMGTPPGFVLVIAQSLSYALGVVLSLCEADDSFDSQGEVSAVSVLCSPAWWNPAVDEPAERRLAERFPSVRLIKQETDFQCLSDIDADKADLVCVVASRPEEDGSSGGGDAGDVSQGLGDSGGRGQGSDVWALGVAVDVLALVPESTRVVVRFDDSSSAKQHQVVSAHVRHRTDAEAARRGRVAAAGAGEEKRGEQGDEKESRLGLGVRSRAEGTKAITAATPAVPHPIDALNEDARREGKGVYFDDTRGVVHVGFDDFYATMSGYVSGDVVIGNAAELVLLQSMLASDVQSLMSDVLNLVSRVPIEAFWPQQIRSKAPATSAGRRHRVRPRTYGEAYRSLLEDHDLLALGIHRPPIGSRGDGPLSAAAAAASGDDDAACYRRCPGGSRYVAINCPSASFPVQDGDYFFVLRRPKQDDRVIAPHVAPASESSAAAAAAAAADGTAASKTATSDSSLDTSVDDNSYTGSPTATYLASKFVAAGTVGAKIEGPAFALNTTARQTSSRYVFQLERSVILPPRLSRTGKMEWPCHLDRSCERFGYGLG